MSTTYWGVYMYQLSHPEVVMPVFTGIPQSVVMGSFGLFFSGVLGFMLTMYSKVCASGHAAWIPPRCNPQ